MKKLILKLIAWSDNLISILLAHFLSKGKDGILLLPAADLNGGFGEDIMVGSFLKAFNKHKLDLIVCNAYDKDYLKDNKQYPILLDKLYLTKLVLLMRKYSELHVIGADIMDGFHKGAGTIRFKSLDLAYRMGLKINLTGLSVRKNFPPKTKKMFLKYSTYGFVKARDIDSYDRLQKFIPTDKLMLVSDLAFLCPDNNQTPSSFEKTKSWIEFKKNAGKTIVAFCPNSIQMQKLGKDVYFRMIKHMIKILVTNDCSVVLLYHDLRRYALDTSDKDISKELYAELNNNDLLYVDDIPDGITLKKYLSLVDFTFTGRMHFGISGYVCGKPMFGISYLNKFEGLQKMFGLKSKETLLDYSNIVNETETIKHFIQNNTTISLTANKNLAQLKKLAEGNFKYQ